MQEQWRNRMIWLFIFLPIFSLVMNEISWLHFGMDLPLADDWRSYYQGKAGSFDLSYLFRSSNDTLYPVGMFLDSLAYRYLDGNTIAYQFISMAGVLGLLLLLQWRLLLLALKDRLLAASAFSLTLLMLQPDTYWGFVNLAYHQAIPLLCILASLYVVLSGRWNNGWGIPTLLVLGLLSGFSYISGAFTMLALSVIFLISSKFLGPTERKPLLVGGLSLLAPAIVTTLAQTWVIAIVQKGTHRPDAPMAWPTGHDFWLYMFGKVARSLMLPIHHPIFSLLITCLMVLVVLALVFWSLRFLMKNKMQTLVDARLAIIYISFVGVIFTYLLLISAGRTNLHPPEIKTATEIFTYGFYRFHFFWVTLLWPWLAALLFVLLKKSNTQRAERICLQLPWVVLLVFIPLIIGAGALKHAKFYKPIMELRADGIKCLLSDLQKGKEINCPQIAPVFTLKKGFFYGRDTGASFTRAIPFLPIPMGTMSPPPLFRLPMTNLENVKISNAQIYPLKR